MTRRRKMRGGYKALAIVGSIIALAILFLLFQAQKERQRKIYEQAQQKFSVVEQQYVQEEKAREEKKANDSFYQKLADGFAVNVLVVGDSIGAGSGAEPKDKSWASQLERELKTRYGVGVSVTNVSLGSTTSYAGYVRTAMLPDDENFDMAIVCYGQNDAPEGFSLYYETIIRAIKNKYPQCSLISILESSQRTYTEKMQTIQRIAAHYGYPTVDTIAPFAENYDALTAADGIHPNNDGHAVYFEKILEQIEKSVAEYRGRDPEEIPPLEPGVTAYDTYRYISVDEFERVDDLTYQLPGKISGIPGIDYCPGKGDDNNVEIYADGALVSTLDCDTNYRYIVPFPDGSCEVNDMLTVSFGTKEAADGFYGLCFSNIG